MAAPTELWLLALALSMDAVAAALARGSGAGGLPALAVGRLAVGAGLVFGLMQGLMPLLGAGLALLLSARLAAVDHWVAFGILLVLGLQMIRAAWHQAPVPDRDRGFSHLLALGLATSIDAAAAGVTLPLFPVPLLLSALLIAATTGLLSAMAVGLGAFAGARLGRWAEAIGGVILVGVGARILLDHLERGI
jgi:putative Mn2+ efflux pump MntP